MDFSDFLPAIQDEGYPGDTEEEQEP